MKILVVSQQYYPESWRIVDTCESLASMGHQVTVLCGLPNDEAGELLPGYADGSHDLEEHNGVKIIRVYEHPRKTGDLNLFLKYSSFAQNASKKAKSLPSDFDVVLLNQLSPIMQAKPAIVYARKNHKKILMYCLDLWPESLSARGIVNKGIKGIVYRHYLHLSEKLYNAMDHILVSSPLYIDYLRTKCHVPFDKLEYLPQYAEDLYYQPAEPCLSPSTQHNFVFAGNVGRVQDCETLVRAASLLGGHPEISIHIVGRGSDLDNVKKLAAELKTESVFFHGEVPLEKIPGIYASADALLISFAKDNLTPYVIPAKLQSCMASGKPILAVASGAVSEEIGKAQCGFCVPSGDEKALASALLSISSMSQEELRVYGEHGREYAKERFSREGYLKQIEIQLSLLANKK